MKYLILLFLSLIFTQATAQDDGYKIGQRVENFSLKTNNGTVASLADLNNSKVVVVVFVNKNCPNGRIYGPRLKSLAESYSSKGVSFLYINSVISMEASGADAKQVPTPASGNDVTVLQDEDQKISKQFGATKIPEVFVLQQTNGSFQLKYKGAIDDNPQLEASVKTNYLQNALDAVLANRSVAVPEKRALGCMIKRF